MAIAGQEARQRWYEDPANLDEHGQVRPFPGMAMLHEGTEAPSAVVTVRPAVDRRRV